MCTQRTRRKNGKVREKRWPKNARAFRDENRLLECVVGITVERWRDAVGWGEGDEGRRNEMKSLRSRSRQKVVLPFHPLQPFVTDIVSPLFAITLCSVYRKCGTY